MKAFAVCPGSYDPVTLGHRNVVLRAVKIFGSCEVVVMNNREKKYRFSLEERFALCREAFRDCENVTVRCYEGMLYEYLSGREGAVLVKGIRNEKDYLYEKEMAVFNREHCGVETLYLDAEKEYSTLSSTVVRQKMKEKENLGELVPENVVNILRNKM